MVEFWITSGLNQETKGSNHCGGFKGFVGSDQNRMKIRIRAFSNSGPDPVFFKIRLAALLSPSPDAAQTTGSGYTTLV